MERFCFIGDVGKEGAHAVNVTEEGFKRGDFAVLFLSRKLQQISFIDGSGSAASFPLVNSRLDQDLRNCHNLWRGIAVLPRPTTRR
ncbi:hypothetical protein H6F98_14415 [Microcoleus sp. FACHB-SPT15]|nr:hypothetical protein [Microcoleus sp. FACHB-SPT15]